jgi:putative alpha-1,2-mannosidase
MFPCLTLLNRSQGWRNVFDSDSGFMRPKKLSGAFDPPETFDQWAWGGAYVEGGPWQVREYN